VGDKFLYYEKVWKSFVGNVGDTPEEDISEN
jgi:hypothetical protein